MHLSFGSYIVGINSALKNANKICFQVNLHVRLSPDQLNRAKDVTMAALAESARQLAESAANLGGHNIHEEQVSYII